MDSHDFQDILDIYFKQKLSKSTRVLKISLNRLKKNRSILSQRHGQKKKRI